ncbi:MAG TPA: transcriptional regulator [Ureibacillus sp.]|nr:transcriptional regulator [Ureibacillus sp.]
MVEYRAGYNYYRNACLQYGLRPIQFDFFVTSLSKEQLDAYNKKAEQKKGA